MLVHTGDFKIDYTPLDHQPTDLGRLAALGAAGVLALFADSTNVDRRGVTGSEIDVTDAFEEVFATTDGKVVVASFASSVYRMQLIVDLAAKFDRHVAFVGRGMQENSQIAQRLGYLRVPTGVGIKDADVSSFAPGDVVCLVTGSQGEPQAALSRIAIDEHRHVSLGPDDTVVLSARAIPGNEKVDRPGHQPPGQAPGRGRDRGHPARPRLGARQRRRAEARPVAGAAALLRPGARRVPAARPPRPGRRASSPADCRRPAGCCSPRTATVSASTPKAAGCSTPCRPAAVLIDGTRTGEVDDEMLRDRRHLATDGLVVPVVVVNRQTGRREGAPEIVARGFVPEAEAGNVLSRRRRVPGDRDRRAARRPSAPTRA